MLNVKPDTVASVFKVTNANVVVTNDARVNADILPKAINLLIPFLLFMFLYLLFLYAKIQKHCNTCIIDA